ncbi:hypothetical protein [Nonomuraea endophytica]|uniref:Sortase n=1 Tax=Nonomuraea endophytica TaxID=714136 RepID=A0A7W8A9X4_9ACTN|nr:hypothetical protein [Nonomuraea endophytica]MBB5080913.1 hypothetical protein [Nonomuraea endophytica]
MFERKRSRGVAVAVGTGALILATLSAASAAVAGEVALVFDRVGDPDDLGAWVRTGDVLRFRVRLAGDAQDARLALAASPGEALSTVTCAPQSPAAGAPGLIAAPPSQAPEAPAVPPSGAPGAASAGPLVSSGSALPDDGSADGRAAGALGMPEAAGALGVPEAAGALGVPEGAGALGVPQVDGTLLPGTVPTPAVGVAARGAEVCRLGKVSGERAVDVRLTVPQGVNEVVLAAVAQVWGSGGVSTLSGTARTPVGTGPMPRPAAAPRPQETVVIPLPTPMAKPAQAGRPAKGDEARPRSDSSYTGPRGALTNVGPRSATRNTSPSGATRNTSPSGVGPNTAPRAVSPYVGPRPGQAAPPQKGLWNDPNLRLPKVAPASAPATEAAGVPLPRQIAVAARTFETNEPMNLLTGHRGLSVAAGGIAVLLVGLWFVARAQRRRIAENQD